MLNGFFDGHSPYMDFTVAISDSNHPIATGLEDFAVTDELHYLKHDPNRSHHLMHAYDPGRDETHVMAYHHTYGQGRVFFFALGHEQRSAGKPLLPGSSAPRCPVGGQTVVIVPCRRYSNPE